MVFPQGVFSTESLAALQRSHFVAAVNTEVQPTDTAESVTVSDLWGGAITRYGGVALFTRRYPHHGLANFAFDIMLGKPCLVVEHHDYFGNGGQQVAEFVDELNALNGGLEWMPLTKVLRRSYHWRPSANGGVEIRLYASEAEVKNSTAEPKVFTLMRSEVDAAEISRVSIGGEDADWGVAEGHLSFACHLLPGVESLCRIHRPVRSHEIRRPGPAEMIRVASRRGLSEFRDRVLARNELLRSVGRWLHRGARLWR
jgi:hypothetical protein